MSRFRLDDLPEEDDYYFQLSEDSGSDRVFVLVIYDIIDNKRRVKFAKLLQGYGMRVQKSAFEAIIPKRKYEKLLKEIPEHITEEDNVRVYKIIGNGQVVTWGNTGHEEPEDIILI